MRQRIGFVVVALGLALGAALFSDLGQRAIAQSAVDVGLGEFVFDPAEILVPAGPVTFNFTNVDSRRHNMVILVNGVELQSETYGAGEGGTWEVMLDQPGTYEFWCSVGNHRERGMVGTLTVQ